MYNVNKCIIEMYNLESLSMYYNEDDERNNY